MFEFLRVYVFVRGDGLKFVRYYFYYVIGVCVVCYGGDFDDFGVVEDVVECCVVLCLRIFV